ncbi:MAG TPA: bifunctional 5,10-methylenetetrahydrofolate dehydrogenase/5,10-methenyltetrahydrofolate cyclohydrolase [Thermococcus sp.]|nr:MAG: bifunctional methylenetetrahydrofolate dehydrogenase/methenyltetrahydrofolate cyclohydrolase [Thermoplasmata archaeon]HDH45128.1 bifunctional 5,10-methylenetetrahydrofolate dehydrogenase/5,10-methenyltetrahydrofolate cyclohydrolase [Thermococcus sp.]
MVKVVDGRKIAREMKEKIKTEIERFESRGFRKPRIANIWFEGSKESELFLRLKEKVCREVGAKSESFSFPTRARSEDVIGLIRKLNADSDIDGISIQAPLPRQIPLSIFSELDPEKDVEGLHPVNIGKLFSGDETIVPCVPQAILEVLERERVELKGKDVVIVNHSMFIGKPLSIILLNRNATVSICHAFTRDIKKFTRNADILIVAVGKPGIIGKEHIKEGAMVIDVGISKGENGVRGDVRMEEVKEKASLITPVPGGIGPVTIASILNNLIKIYRRRMEHE